jgi:hypothetical protein
MPTIAGQAITSGSIRIPEQGDWFGDISTNASERIPDGTRVEIVVENVTLSGAIVRGNITGDVGRYQVAGRPEWDKPIKPRAYQSAANVLRKTVLSDLCRDVLGANWQSLVELPTAANLGNHFERPGTFGAVEVLARDVLELLELPWYVRADGVTVFAPRPSGAVSTEQQILVSKRNDAIGYRVVNCKDLAAFSPGLTFEGETIGDITYAIRPDDVESHVWTRKAANEFAMAIKAWWRRMFPRVEIRGDWEFLARGPKPDGTWDLIPTDKHLHGLGITSINSILCTIAGHGVTLQSGTAVVVSFLNGDPSRPRITGILSSILPQTASFGAVTSIGIDAASVDLGGALSSVITAGIAVTIDGPNPVAGVIRLDPLDPIRVIPTKVKA